MKTPMLPDQGFVDGMTAFGRATHFPEVIWPKNYGLSYDRQSVA